VLIEHYSTVLSFAGKIERKPLAEEPQLSERMARKVKTDPAQLRGLRSKKTSGRFDITSRLPVMRECPKSVGTIRNIGAIIYAVFKNRTV
jgi:hypothetical protein